MKTASSLNRIRMCPPSYALRVKMGAEGMRRIFESSSSNQDAAAGTRRHGAMEAAIDLGTLPERFKIYVGERARTEVSYSHDTLTGIVKELPPGTNRNYPEAPPTVTFGTTDCVSWIDEEMLSIVDWKGPHADLPPISQNDQLWFAALCASRIHGVDNVQIATVRIDDADPDADDDLPQIVGVPMVTVLTRYQLEAYEENMRRIDGQIAVAVRDIQEGRDPLCIPGAHCAYCPTAPACPATISAISIASSPPAKIEEFPAALLVEMLSAVDAAEKKIRSHLASVVQSDGPIDLGDGYAYGPVVVDGNEKIDATIAAPVLVGELGMSAELAIKKSVSKTGIKAAAKEVAPKGKAAALERDVLGKLRAAGAISRDQSTKLMAYRAADAIPADLVES